ncbi:Mth938-like domain-containing protein [Thiogranum longum]|nr:Mth938-like domain-containing protein [Thiogranum longum]
MKCHKPQTIVATMHFVQEDFSSDLLIRGYDDGEIRVGGQSYNRSIILTHQRIIDDWRPQNKGELEAGDFELIRTLDVEIMLLGTGSVLSFPSPALTAPLLEAGIGVEVMDTAAACRTFNVLLAEGRPVAAALLLG